MRKHRTMALLEDVITHNAIILDVNGESYRKRRKKGGIDYTAPITSRSYLAMVDKISTTAFDYVAYSQFWNKMLAKLYMFVLYKVFSILVATILYLIANPKERVRNFNLFLLIFLNSFTLPAKESNPMAGI